MIELESVKRMESLKQSIETATGESYEDLTGAVKDAIERTEWESVWYELSGTLGGSYHQGLFRNATFKEPPRMLFTSATHCGNMYELSQVETIPYRIGGEKTWSYYRTFRDCKNLKFLYGLAVLAVTSFVEALNGCEALETIQEPLEFSNSVAINFAGAFTGCYALENIRFAENCIGEITGKSLSFAQSPLLTAESVQSIAYGLAYISTAQTIVFHKDIVVPDDLKALILEKGWTLVQQ